MMDGDPISSEEDESGVRVTGDDTDVLSTDMATFFVW